MLVMLVLIISILIWCDILLQCLGVGFVVVELRFVMWWIVGLNRCQCGQMKVLQQKLVGSSVLNLLFSVVRLNFRFGQALLVWVFKLGVVVMLVVWVLGVSVVFDLMLRRLVGFLMLQLKMLCGWCSLQLWLMCWMFLVSKVEVVVLLVKFWMFLLLKLKVSGLF